MKPYTFCIPLFMSLSMAMAQRPLVVLDPGHGGMDPGAIGANGILEKEVVLGVVRECLRLNRALFRDSLEIYLTRYGDTLISLGERGRLAKVLKADAFVSIHCNQAPNHRAQGFEIFVYDQPVDTKARALADAIGHRLNGTLGIHERGMKRANFQVLRETYGHCPAILLEIGFISNTVEADHAQKMESRTAIALALLESLIKTLYYE